MHVETELLAYLDEELADRDRADVEAHVATCPRCAAELERLRVLRQELDATLDAALAPVRLPAAADSRIRERLLARVAPRPLWGLWQRRGLIVQGLLATLVLAFALNTAHVLSLPTPPTPPPPHETLVFGQNRLAPGSKAALRVVVRSAGEAKPVEGAEVIVRLGRAPGLARIVYAGSTDGGGTANVGFDVPDDLEGEASLVVETSHAGGEDQIVHPITVERSYRLLLTSDKPAYRLGQTIHLRALALDAIDLQAAAGQQVAFDVLDPCGEGLHQLVNTTSEHGIAALDFSLPADADHGEYTLQARLGDATSQRTVTVGDYKLPAFRVALETDRAFYAPGERVTGSVRATYFFGKPVANARVTLRGYGDAPPAPRERIVQGVTNEEGAYRYAFVLPEGFGGDALEGPALFDLQAEVVDSAGRLEGIRYPLPVAAQPILIRAIPDSGVLKLGIENTIFVLTAYPDGLPAETTLTVEADGFRQMLSTGPFGLAEFPFVPTRASTELTVRARDAQGVEGSATFELVSDRAPQALLLRAERAAYEVGDTLRAEVLVGGTESGASQTVFLDIVRARQTVATLSAPAEGGQAAFALDLDGTMVGTLELHAYVVPPDGGPVEDTRLVVVDAPRQVALAVRAGREEYRPGEVAHLAFESRIASAGGAAAQPVQSALGIAVVDESMYALETLPPGFARAYLLLEQELLERRGEVPSLDETTLLEAEVQAQAAQDVAARAAWAGVPGTGFSLSTRSVRPMAEPTDHVARRITPIARRISLILILLPALLSTVVVTSLWHSRALGRALRRVAIGALVLFVASPLLALGAWLMWLVLRVGAPIIVLAIVTALLTWLTIHGWRRRDVRAQTVTGFLVAYLTLGGLLVYLAGRGGHPESGLVVLIAITFPLTVIAVVAQGQGLVVEGWRREGWATTLLGLLLIALVVYLPFVPGLASDLTHALGSPALYAGPVGWLAGCTAPAATQAPAAGEPTQEMPPEEVTREEPTKEPAVAPTTTPVASPRAPFPLRQVFPETLYWNPEAVTDESGRLTIELELADSITTWRLAALASTQDGEIGFTTYDLVVFQDFFVELETPRVVAQGETVTVTATLYNYVPQPQMVRVEPVAAEWYNLVEPPKSLILAPNDVGTTQFIIRAEQPGDFSLQVNAVSERMSDGVAVDVTVTAP